MKTKILQALDKELQMLEEKNNLRRLPQVAHNGREVTGPHGRMLNLSSNDYLALASDIGLRREFLEGLTPETFLPSASSSRLLTGNFGIYSELEGLLCKLFHSEAALVFNSGYHMNAGILPAVSDAHTLILADKLVHASLIDGIRLSTAKCIRYRHNHYEQLEHLLNTHKNEYEKIIIVTESIFSMDGDEADLRKLCELKKQYPNVLLYLDEAHAIGVRGTTGLGCAEEQNCINDIDFLTGTFGKALASVGGYVICKKIMQNFLVNKMRTLIFTTALPPVNLMWTKFILERLGDMEDRRKHLHTITQLLINNLTAKGYQCPSASQIVPLITGNSRRAVLKAEEMQKKGFYMLPVRPPTVPEGTSRIRISLTSGIQTVEINKLITLI